MTVGKLQLKKVSEKGCKIEKVIWENCNRYIHAAKLNSVHFSQVKIILMAGQKGLEFPGGWGFCTAKKFKEMYEA